MLLGRSDYTPAVDEWSIGCIFGELLIGSYLFEGRNEVRAKYKVVTQIRVMRSAVRPFEEHLSTSWAAKVSHERLSK